MKKYILGTILSLGLLVSPAFVPQAEAASLTPVQVTAIISLLQAFGADQSVIANVQTVLGGGSATSSGTSPTALITVNGQSSVTNADPLVSRTWAWSGTPGSTYTASGNITGCDTASQNGPQSNWKPWTDTKATGNATSGSSSVIPGAVKYGCVIVGTYNVTKDGKTTTSNATITYKHADGSANTATTPPSQTSATKVSFVVNEYVAGGAIPSNQYNLGFWGGTDLTCSLVSGPLPPGVTIESLGDIDNTGHTGCALVGVPRQVGVYNITWKGTGKQMNSDPISSQSGDLEITIYTPRYRARFSGTMPGELTVGVPFQTKFWYVNDVKSTAEDEAYLSRGMRFVNYASLSLIDSNSGIPGLSLETRPGLSDTGLMSGTPSVAGTYHIRINMGISTDPMAGDARDFTVIVKPRTQSQTELNAEIKKTYDSLNWADSSKSQSASSFLQIIKQKGWTLDDVSSVTGLSVTSLAKLLYPDNSDKNNIDMNVTATREAAIQVQIMKTVSSLDWTGAHMKESAVAFVALMNKEGWTWSEVVTPYIIQTGWVPTTPDFMKEIYSELNKAPSCDDPQAYYYFYNPDVASNPDYKNGVHDAVYHWNTYGWNEGRKSCWTTHPIEGSSLTAVPHLTTLSPSSGKAGTTVTITASGLLGTNSIYLNGTLVDTESNSGGSTPTWISFVIPGNLPSCPAWDRFCTSGPVLTPGTYTVSVQNTNGTSNTVSFVVN